MKLNLRVNRLSKYSSQPKAELIQEDLNRIGGISAFYDRCVNQAPNRWVGVKPGETIERYIDGKPITAETILFIEQHLFRPQDIDSFVALIERLRNFKPTYSDVWLEETKTAFDESSSKGKNLFITVVGTSVDKAL